MNTLTQKPKRKRIPVYNKPVEQRIKELRSQLYAGMDRMEAKWHSICADVKALDHLSY